MEENGEAHMEASSYVDNVVSSAYMHLHRANSILHP